MKCEHGNEVVVVLTTIDPKYWDDGVKAYQADGTEDFEGNYLLLNGCAHCSVIKFERH